MAIDSALARPLNRTAYGTTDAAGLAAAGAFGLARNHGFLVGDKRPDWVFARLFLIDNGICLRIDPFEALAAGTLSEPALAAWFRERFVV